MSIVLGFAVVKLTCLSISNTESDPQGENLGSPARVIGQEPAPRKSGTTSDSDSASMKPHQETWRVIGGGVMLGTATSAYSHETRLKSS